MRQHERIEIEASSKEPQGYLIYLMHIAAYRWSALQMRNKRVLDFGCGTGYGAHDLCSVASHVTGVDVSEAGIAHARRSFEAPNLEFAVISPVEEELLPFPDGHFDAVMSNQVIEHVPSPENYIREAARVLIPDGILIVVTPNRLTRLFAHQRPWNRFHVDEFSPDKLEAVVSEFFENVDVFGMAGRDEVLAMEMDRTRRLRTLLLPFTFPGAPEWLRQAGLGAVDALSRLKRAPVSRPIKFENDAVWIGENSPLSLNVVVRGCRKKANISGAPAATVMPQPGNLTPYALVPSGTRYEGSSRQSSWRAVSRQR